MLDQQVLLHPVDLDLDGGGRRTIAHGCGVGQRAAGIHPQLLEGAKRGARRPTDVVDATLQAVELLDDRQRDDHIRADEAGDAHRVGDQYRGVEHDPCPHTPLKIDMMLMGGDKIGQRNSNRLFGMANELRNATVVAEQARAMVDSGSAGRMQSCPNLRASSAT